MPASKTILGFFLNPLLFIFSYIVPKQDNLYLFGCGNGQVFKGNPKYTFLHINRNKNKYKGLRAIWITENKTILEDLRSSNLPVIYKYSFQAFLTILISKYIIIDQSAKDFSYLGVILGNFNIVQTWHGIPLKDISVEASQDKTGLVAKFWNALLTQERYSYSLIVSTSEVVSRNFQKAFGNKSIKITGYPRNDVFYNPNAVYTKLQKHLKLGKYKKVIAYIPTFRDVDTELKPFSNSSFIKLNQYLKDQNCLMVVKKHPFDKSLFDNIKHKNLSNIIDISKQVDDVQELLVCTDLLITDYSSVLFDFILTGKPIIYYPYDYDRYLSSCRSMYYNYFEELPGPFAHNPSGLMNLLKAVNNWIESKTYIKQYQKLLNKFQQYQDGQSAQRLIKAINKL